MPQPFLGEIRLFSCSFAPDGWAICNGQLMQITQNQALFALLGTTYYGGDGVTTFALPNLQGRAPVGVGNQFVLGNAGGEETHTLASNELPPHLHTAIASSNTADQISSANNFWANSGAALFGAEVETTMAPVSVLPIGGGQAHNNLSAYLVLNFCIALQGIFPSHN